MASPMTDTLWSADANSRSRPRVADRALGLHAHSHARLGGAGFVLSASMCGAGVAVYGLPVSGRRRRSPIAANCVYWPQTRTALPNNLTHLQQPQFTTN